MKVIKIIFLVLICSVMKFSKIQKIEKKMKLFDWKFDLCVMSKINTKAE